MPVPGSGELSLGKIGKELRSSDTDDDYDNGPDTSNATSLKDASEGDIDALNTDVKGYAGMITGITTSVGIGTDLAIVFQLDTNDLINANNDSYVKDFKEGYPFKVYG